MVMTDLWVAGTTNPRAKVRLFCFPYAGGNTLIYRAWPQYLPSEIELRPVRLPGREGRFKEACYQNIVPFVQALTSGLSSYLDLPFAFFGHSTGALLAFEVTRALRRHGSPEPLCLMISGRGAPHLPLCHDPFHKLSDPELIEILRHYGGTPEMVLQNEELMELFLPVIRSDFTVNETYVHVPEAPLDCPICAFGSEVDELAPRVGVDAWREQTNASFTLHTFSGGHFYLDGADRPSLVRMVAKELETLISQGK
uniref:Medium-chain acyl-[acyl-carrier-protein] hydrolase n=1 Tax=Candidatus Kentrum sp. LFY TaxID=2126342 RepID=A0A450V6N4_9GAMM|nr:MAG: medium-chain acyl-[acyl-carrier-protein] hydrolase [Candidatus Kentron sp. LFY]